MKRDYIDFQDRSVPVAYLITIRCYGTWLHGDDRGSMDRGEHNRYGAPKIAPKPALRKSDETMSSARQFELGTRHRKAVKEAIQEVCEFRGHRLFALNVRSNHAHAVVSAGKKVELIMHSFKAYATRKLRSSGLIDKDTKVWSRHGSTRYLWTDNHIENAVEYVLYGQGDDLPEFE